MSDLPLSTHPGRAARLGWTALAVGALVLGANAVFTRTAKHIALERQISFVDERPDEILDPVDTIDPATLAELPPPVPFEAIDVLDDEAHAWTQGFSVYGGTGVLTFDANGDGRLDIYLCHDGQNWTRPTDESAILQEEPRVQPNGLYLNTGNDAQGDPTFARVDVLAAGNPTHQAEELLVEGLLFPRRSVDEPRARPGRIANVALAADFNADGRPDLLVGNYLPGSPWSHPNTQRVLQPFVAPIGRETRHSKTPLPSLTNHLIKDYRPRYSAGDTRQSARGEESLGANTLYLNLGDRDGDGVPEWEDASRAAGIEGCRTTSSLAVADVDLDGDLDIYEGNVMDPDYWPGGAKGWAGAANCLYINQLAETGELRFVERGAEMNVDGVFDADYPMPDYFRVYRIPVLPVEYSLMSIMMQPYTPELLEIEGQTAENAEISWATVFQDANRDGYPDLWVANDLGHLRLYLNQEGKGFVDTPHARTGRSGMWMTFAPADFDGDGLEDLLAGNMGGGMLSHAFVAPDPYLVLDPTMTDSLAFAQFFLGKQDTTHLLVDGRDPTRDLVHKVKHSRVLPPDTSLPNNFRQTVPIGREFDLHPFEPDSIDPYEFAWGMVPFDAQNDGRTDLYYLGCLYSRGGGLFPVAGTCPGRFLANATPSGGELRFVDLTAEHHLFDIREVQYDKLADDGYVYRRAPAQNWRLRDMVYSYDRSSWTAQGVTVKERVTNQDFVQTAELGRGLVAADLNGDGFLDLVRTHLGGYDSRSPQAKNLKAMIDGRPQVIPAPHYLYPSLTNFDPGYTEVLMNRYRGGHWLRVRLVDDSPQALNRDAIGAVVRVNGQLLRVKRAGDGGYLGNVLDDLHLGLGEARATEIEVTWPDRERTVSTHRLDGLANGRLTVAKQAGIRWEPAPASGG